MTHDGLKEHRDIINHILAGGRFETNPYKPSVPRYEERWSESDLSEIDLYDMSNARAIPVTADSIPWELSPKDKPYAMIDGHGSLYFFELSPITEDGAIDWAEAGEFCRVFDLICNKTDWQNSLRKRPTV